MSGTESFKFIGAYFLHFAGNDLFIRPVLYRWPDVGVNLTDPVFRGKYHGKKKHEDDLEAMLDRARAAGVISLIITGGSLSESREALKLARKYSLYCTIGCHPTRSNEFNTHKGGPDQYLQALDQLIGENLEEVGRVVALGECGLDYDRTHFASPETQKKYFRLQLKLAKKHNLPLFLHSRAAHADFVNILKDEGFGIDKANPAETRKGVVHSFTGTTEEMKELVEMGFYISVNGCSLKTEENLKTTGAIPLERLLLETDAPWCSMTSAHASKSSLDKMPENLRAKFYPPATKPEKFVLGKSVKGRNEPAAIGGVAWVVHSLNDVSLEEVMEITRKNTVDLFRLGEIPNM